MVTKVKHTSQTLLDKKFKPAEKGYNPLEVDEFFDEIIKDYKLYEKEVTDLKTKCADQSQEIENLKKELRAKEVEVAEAKNKYSGLPKGTNVSEDNIKYLKKIDLYERALYKKGIDPKKLLSDPDNC